VVHALIVRKKMKTLIISLILGFTLPAFAGSADAIIRGKTESGRTEVEVHVGDINGLIRYVKLTVDGKSFTVSDADMLSQSVIDDRENGIYVLVLRAEGREFRLWMIPKSEKVTKQGSGVYRSSFAAVIEATDPRKSDGSFTPRITIGCRLDYQI
jgi:hypothetical protein